MTPAVRRDGMKFIRNIWKVVSCKLQGKRMDGCERVSRPMEQWNMGQSREHARVDNVMGLFQLLFMRLPGRALLRRNYASFVWRELQSGQKKGAVCQDQQASSSAPSL